MRIKTPNEFKYIILKLNDFFSRIALLKTSSRLARKLSYPLAQKKKSLP